MTKTEAEKLINYYSVENSKYLAEDSKQRARESKLRADMVETQLQVYQETLKLLREQGLSGASLQGFGKNGPFTS